MKYYKGKLALHSCILSNDVTALKKLLAKEVNVNKRDDNAQTPLHLAALNPNKEITLLLKDKGADPHIVDCHGAIPLHLAAQKGNFEVTRLLLDMGSHVNVQDRYGNTPLHHTAYEGHVDVAGALLANGANPNILNHSWLTTLAIALKNCDTPLTRLLKAADAKVPKSVIETIKLAYIGSSIFRRFSMILFSTFVISFTLAATILSKGELFLSLIAAICASIGFSVVCLNTQYYRMRNLEAKIFSGAITQTEVDHLLFAKKRAVSIEYITDTAYIQAHNDNNPKPKKPKRQTSSQYL